MFHPPSILFPVLVPLSWLYGAAVRARSRRIASSTEEWFDRLETPVLSIGNLTVGGTGKTPFAELCAKMLAAEGRRVGILSRGYGRSGSGPKLVSEGSGLCIPWVEAGDEPALLAAHLPDVPIAVAERRVEAGRLLESLEGKNFDAFLLDDGFQHRRLRRQLDIVLLHARAPWGNGRLLPAGPLREPKEALQRADVVVLTGCDPDFPASPPDIPELRPHLSPSATILRAATEVEGLRNALGEKAEPLDRLKDGRVLAFSGIANPASFRSTLRSVGARVVKHVEFGDHHAFTPRDLGAVWRTASRLGVDWILTTEKDAVRLRHLSIEDGPPLRAISIRTVVDKPEALRRLLLEKAPGPV